MTREQQIGDLQIDGTDETSGKDIDLGLEQLLLIEMSRPLTPHELVMKGRYIQLRSEGPQTLDDAERAFLMALELDPDYVPAILELAWFYHSVLGQPSRALPFFENAYRLSLNHLREALKGRAESRAELDSQASFEKLLGELTGLACRDISELIK
jgi:tetratricopeptide (TPR) repeat protein